MTFLSALSACAVSGAQQIGFAFINSEIESSLGIDIIEDCYNGGDDDGDTLVDTNDTFDCFNIPNSNVTNSSIVAP